MRIPVFGSCPTYLSKAQLERKKILLGELDKEGLEWRSIGQTDYPVINPLTEVLMLARHCAGGMILGFQQFKAPQGRFKVGTPAERKVSTSVVMPTPWNQIEAGLLFSLGKPLIVFRESGISGGIFDAGVSDVFIHDMPKVKMSIPERKALKEVFRRFASDVRTIYYKR